MAFQDQEMAFESFGDHGDREMQQRLSASGGSGAPTWLSDAILRRNDDDDDDDVVPGTMPPGAEGANESEREWVSTRHKSEIAAHPLYERLLDAHVACLRIATPVDQLPRIDAQVAQSRRVLSKYSLLPKGEVDEKELDQFMTHYVLLLCSFKEQLQQHVRVHAMEAVMSCWELEQSLQSLTAATSIILLSSILS
ncbi:hypothetical protein FH972_020889 [Carpinus fangiana]|uniref:KNOX1 domain-containing protein n=1 Tax=Carpinus fangiana TaxID=176857 RepID=A0A5N6RUW1_9ROSI|nr:hypothetical protein FH972_020889 [Carpinus fangiana]